MINDTANQEGEFANLRKDIADTVNSALGRYSKYYDFIDSQDIYYIALILNPRYKTYLLEQELRDGRKLIIEYIKDVLHREYPLILPHLPLPVSTISTTTPILVPLRQKLKAKLLAKIQRSVLESDIDRYFNNPLAQIPEDTANDPNWLFDW